MEFLGAIFAFMRDLAIFAAAVGIAKWAWEAHSQGPQLRDSAARAAIDGERRAADLRQGAARLEAIAVDISTRLDEVLGRTREAELRAGVKARIHKLLQATTDPYLTYSEIAGAVHVPGGETEVNGGGSEPASNERDVALRRALIELIADRAIAQLAGDRYFIASEFETDADEL